ncbi:MAG: hypothetical protein MJ231_07185 [bacterium]|nr:hypothetical protein [bacterium]
MLSVGGKILCRTVGVAGMGLALYDAVQSSKAVSRHQGLVTQGNFLEDRYFASRTTDDVSSNQTAISKKTFDVMTKSPIPGTVGKVKGACKGFVMSLGTNLAMICSAALALVSKGFLAKLGTVGVIGTAVYQILRQGFGVGKKNPFS